MAYKQKASDISGLMMKMKSSSSYGGKSALMKMGEPEVKKPTKPVFGGEFSYGSKTSAKYSMDKKSGKITLPGGKSYEKGDTTYKQAHKKYTDAFQMAMTDYSKKMAAYNKKTGASEIKTKEEGKE